MNRVAEILFKFRGIRLVMSSARKIFWKVNIPLLVMKLLHIPSNPFHYWEPIGATGWEEKSLHIKNHFYHYDFTGSSGFQ